MRLEFLGLKQEEKKGCSSCGSRRTSNYVFKREKRMILPSGRVMNFFVGNNYEVTQLEGEFLLAQKYALNGKMVPMFKEICDGSKEENT